MSHCSLTERVLRHVEDEDALFEALDRDTEDQQTLYRERRISELKGELSRVRELQSSQHGSCTRVLDEKEVLNITTSTKRCVVHFVHADFRRCQILNQHIMTLAKHYFNTRFIKVDVEDVPFLVDRLKIQVLPCLLSFIDGVVADRLVGFEELGNTDNFKTEILERRLLRSGVIESLNSPSSGPKTILGFPDAQYTNSDSEENDD